MTVIPGVIGDARPAPCGRNEPAPMFTPTDRRRIAVAGLISASVLGLAGCPRHHATIPAPATTSTAQSATTLAYPSQVSIPSQLAQALGQVRASTARVCARGSVARSWAEIDEDGNVTDVNSACVAGK